MERCRRIHQTIDAEFGRDIRSDLYSGSHLSVYYKRLNRKELAQTFQKRLRGDCGRDCRYSDRFNIPGIDLIVT